LDELKSRIILPLKERESLLFCKRVKVSVWDSGQENLQTHLELVSIKDYHKAISALEICEKQLLELLSKV
jgi:hypothetical protein